MNGLLPARTFSNDVFPAPLAPIIDVKRPDLNMPLTFYNLLDQKIGNCILAFDCGEQSAADC